MPIRFVVFFVCGGFAVRRLQPDIIHTMGALIPIRADVVSVHFCHAGARQIVEGSSVEGVPISRRINTSIARTLAVLAERWCYRPSRGLTVAPVSVGVAAEIQDAYPGIPSVIVPNGVDVTRFHADDESRLRGRTAHGVNPSDVVALFVGGDWHRKGLKVTMEAVADVRAMGRPIRLWVVGIGDEDRFNRLGKGLGLAKSVTFFGRQSSPEAFYQAADIFVLPTNYESFSMVAHEAAACGLPIVATGVSGIAELVGANEAGIIVQPRRNSVADALDKLSGDKGLRREMGRTGVARVQPLTWEASATEMLAIYEGVLASRLGQSCR